MNKQGLFSLFFLIFCALLAVLIVFLAKGYILNLDEKKIVKTGIIHAVSIPSGASVYLDGELASATDSTLSNLEPKVYDIKITKDGYSTWTKKIDVKAELVTEIEALLIPTTPELKPATHEGIIKFFISPNQDKAAILIGDDDKSGIWILSFNNLPFGSGYSIKQIVKDQPDKTFSRAQIEWSEDGTQILTTISNSVDQEKSYLLETDRLNENLELLTNKERVLEIWQKEKELVEAQRKEHLDEEGVKIYSEGKNIFWSPNKQQFFFQKEGQYFVYSLEKREVTQLKDTSNQKIQYISWYPDSKHLVLVEDYQKNEGGKVLIVESDGGNRATAYEGYMTDSQILVSPDGKKIFLATSFNRSSNTSTLYYLNLQ